METIKLMFYDHLGQSSQAALHPQSWRDNRQHDSMTACSAEDPLLRLVAAE
jgi:hypothetical protein